MSNVTLTWLLTNKSGESKSQQGLEVLLNKKGNKVGLTLLQTTVSYLEMSRFDSDSELEGPPSKMRKGDDQDDGGGGRSGRVRKKSAKVLEMEEFEQVEKTQHVTKKGKTPKAGARPSLSTEEQELPGSMKKSKANKSPAGGTIQTEIDSTPTFGKTGKSLIKSELNAQLAKPVEQFVPVQASGLLTTGIGSGVAVNPTELLAATMKSEIMSDASETMVPQQQLQTNPPIKTEDSKSVIKYLLSSPTSSAKPAVNTNALTKIGISGAVDGADQTSSGKKVTKKPKTHDKSATKVKPKEKKPKPAAETAMDISELDPAVSSLKMKIFASSDPTTAQVTLNPKSPAKPKKTKKSKQQSELEQNILLESQELFDVPKQEQDVGATPAGKKQPAKKASKKKEKLIQDAISAAQQMPNLAALVASQSHLPGQTSNIVTTTPKQQKPTKKKMKTSPVVSALEEANIKPELLFGDDGEEETNLIIAETEKKKKKTSGKKKVLTPKDKGALLGQKAEKAGDKKISKRAPTAYMLFCNTHRPTIVQENPGIEFAGISRKLGEMWQMLSNKQKLQWRRKAQRRRKKGSNLISTGKASKELALNILTPSSSTQSQSSPGLKVSTLVHKGQRSSSEETPQSPTKNFSIEPIDVAAHLKLLGESLSIIGMRLQEHKGMIAVQGSLSVLLDSLLCACGPLLCLTQQVPGMDGCSPMVHGQTLDRVAYVMPGL